MKATAAVLLTAQITPAGLAVSGVMIGAILLLLGLTGWITRLARLVPQSVLAGLQLGLGFALALLSLALMATAPLIAVPTLRSEERRGGTACVSTGRSSWSADHSKKKE